MIDHMPDPDRSLPMVFREAKCGCHQGCQGGGVTINFEVRGWDVDHKPESMIFSGECPRRIRDPRHVWTAYQYSKVVPC